MNDDGDQSNAPQKKTKTRNMHNDPHSLIEVFARTENPIWFSYQIGPFNEVSPYNTSTHRKQTQTCSERERDGISMQVLVLHLSHVHIHVNGKQQCSLKKTKPLPYTCVSVSLCAFVYLCMVYTIHTFTLFGRLSAHTHTVHRYRNVVVAFYFFFFSFYLLLLLLCMCVWCVLEWVRAIQQTNVKVCNGLRAIRDWLDDWLTRFRLLFVVVCFFFTSANPCRSQQQQETTPLIFERFHFNGILTHTHAHLVVLQERMKTRTHRHYGTPQRCGLASAGARIHILTHALTVGIFNFLFSYFLVSSLSLLYLRVRRHFFPLCISFWNTAFSFAFLRWDGGVTFAACYSTPITMQHTEKPQFKYHNCWQLFSGGKMQQI